MWKAKVDAYEQSWTPRRVFPQQLLVGAEEVLARVLFEFEESRCFTPISLGEILQLRAFTADGQVNSLATRANRDAKALKITQGGGTASLEVADREFIPQSQWAILDALEAVKWCMVWVGFAQDDEVEVWVGIFKKLARKYPQRMDLVKSVYDAASWRLALAMRSGVTFVEAAKEIKADSDWFREYQDNFRPRQNRGAEGGGAGAWSNQRQSDRQQNRGGAPRPWGGAGGFQPRFQQAGTLSFRTNSRSRSIPRRTGDGRGGAGGGGGGRTFSPPRREGKPQPVPQGQRDWGRDWKKEVRGTNVCIDYQFRDCQRIGKCPKGHKHLCAKCERGGHGAFDCGSGR